MTSVVLRTTADLLVSVLLLFSLLLLVRGHHYPGGGFAGGLVAGASYWLYALADDVEAVRQALPVAPNRMVAWGLLGTLAVAVLPLTLGGTLLQGMWISVPLPGGGTVDLGTPLALDVGVFVLVTGATLAILFAMEEEA